VRVGTERMGVGREGGNGGGESRGKWCDDEGVAGGRGIGGGLGEWKGEWGKKRDGWGGGE